MSPDNCMTKYLFICGACLAVLFGKPVLLALGQRLADVNAALAGIFPQ